VVVLGIGSGVDVNEVNKTASAPPDNNVILVHNFSSLAGVEEQLRNASCSGRYSIFPNNFRIKAKSHYTIQLASCDQLASWIA